MATNYDAAVNSFYLAYYGRPADPAGLAYWSQALAQNNGDFSAIVDAFSTSAEATSRFGNATPSDRIADVYQQLFNRAPDAAGLAYWTKAIETGTITIADAAIQIMNGARSTDAQLSTLRQEAAAQFTADVAASGTAYDGTAAIEAARVLIAAITPDTTATDIKSLVTATKSLVQTAHDNPDVITALAGSGNLTTLLASSSGKADPVAMVEALASVGKAAASDAGALTTLKQGGGMAGIVNTLPAGASLNDVAQAADKGGLTAVTDIVKPADTTPPAAPKVALVADTGPSATDHITNNGQIKVSGLEAGSTWQYTFDGKTWHAGSAADASGVALVTTTANGDQTMQVRSTDAAGNVSAVTALHYTLNTLTIQGPDGKDLTTTNLVTNTDNYWVNLYGAKGAAAVGFQVSDTGADGTWADAKDSDPLADGTHFIRYVVTNTAGKAIPTNALKIVMNHALPSAPAVQLVQDTGASATDHITSNSQVKVSGLDAAAVWSYSVDAGQTWTAGPAANTDGTAQLDLGAGTHSLLVRAFEQAGDTETFSLGSLDYTVLTAVSTRLAFQALDGKDSTATNLLTNTDNFGVNLYGAKGAATVGFQVSSTGKDGTWVDAKDSDPLSDGTHFIRYVVTDIAGNTGTTNALEVDMDKAAPAAPTVALFADTGASATDHITSNGSINVSGLEAGATWQYSTDNGAHWTAGGPIDPQGHSSLYNSLGGAQTVQVRSTDAAGNTSDTTTFNYTLEKAPIVTLNLAGQFVWDVTTNNKGLNFQLDLHGHANDLTTTYQISTTGNAADFQAWDSSKALADGTYYFRAVGTDVAGNPFTTNNVTVHLDNTAPAAPTGVQLQADTGVPSDGITTNGAFVVSGLQKDTLWQFSSDGKIWYQGVSAGDDGTAIGFAQATGEQTVQVRTFDKAGNTSDPVSLHFTLDSHIPADGLKLDHIGPDGAKGDFHTALQTPDVVFSYTGTVESGDTLEYTLDFMGNDNSTWTKIDSASIDTTAKTITLHNFDLSTADAFITIHGTDLAGANALYQQVLDGPFTSYFTQYSASGPQFELSGQTTANLYLTDGSNAPVKLPTLDASGGLVANSTFIAVGAQATAMQGVLGVGNDPAVLTVNDKGTYALGTTGADTLSGNYVWGFGGDDTITATGSATYNSAVIAGGEGADTIHTETSSTQLMYQGSADSFLAADDAVAHGFDTVYLSNSSSAKFTDTLRFAGLKFGDLYNPKAAANFSGNETGNALLAALNTAIGSSFKTGGDVQLALVNFGVDGNGHAVNFLAIDTDKDGHIGSADIVIEIVGSIGSSSFYTQNGDGFVYLQTQSVA